MSDLAAVALAACVAVGAAISADVPVAVALGGVAAAFLLQRPALLCVAAALLASSLGARAWSGLAPPDSAPVSGRATLVSDPRWRDGAVQVRVRVDGRRYDAWVRGEARSTVSGLLAGERVTLRGTVTPLPPDVARRLASAHVVGRMSVTAARPADRGVPVARIANVLRRTLAGGATSLPERDRALFGGFVLGDDREHDPLVVDDFRGSGLSHLLVVSGQNVAFVLALAAPLVRRGPLSARLGLGLLVLVLFGTLTRWEPSVLRAEAMAAVSMTAVTLGRPLSAVRLLALAAAAVVLVDPLLVHSLGFRLSVAACAGIALLAAPIEARLPGPPWLRPVAAVTMAAQIGVAPLLLGAFGGLPLVGLPANLLAVPAAAPLMTWGLTAGTVAGVVGGTVAEALHVPTRVLIGWVAFVARVAAGAPFPYVTPRTAAGLCALVAVAWGWRRLRVPMACASLALLASSVIVPTGVATAPDPELELFRSGGRAVLVVGRLGAPRALAAVRSAGVRRVDVIVARRRSAAEAVGVLRVRLRARLVLAPAGTRLGGFTAPADGTVLAVGSRRLRVSVDGDTLDVGEVPGRRGPAPRPRAG